MPSTKDRTPRRETCVYPTFPALKVTKHRAAGCLSWQRGPRYPSHLHTPNTPGKHWPNSRGRPSILPLSKYPPSPPLPFPGNSHFREEPAALRNRAASCPLRDRGGSRGSSGTSLSKKRGWDRQAGRPPGSLPRGRSRGGGGGWVFCPSRATSPRQSRLGGSGFLSYKVSSGRRLRPAPRSPPAPPPSGLGRGGGSKNSYRSPAEEPGGRRRAENGDPPRGGRGAGEGREGRRCRSRCPRRPGRRFTSGSPPPPAGGRLPGVEPRLMHSAARCYGPGRVAEAAARWGTRPAPLGAAPAPGSRMCRCGWDPLPPPWGSLAPRPGTNRSSGPSSASSPRRAAD
ncbi:basic salivary proline-rich protein 3-like [Cervus elaphus]|uniref:basic salivary proline-rich protein 3-like n=1 Tax=Cervus elaphus TaxID=9860 RepID=UPI001CC293BC|nr:basic salivary proline-rich protein 3-like [Cervus elaphus]